MTSPSQLRRSTPSWRPLTSLLSLSGPAFSPSASSPSTSRTLLPTLDPVPEPPQLPLLVVLPLQPPLPSKRSRKKRKKNQRRNPMTTWDSVSSTKKLSLLTFTEQKIRSTLMSHNFKLNFVLCICDLNIECEKN